MFLAFLIIGSIILSVTLNTFIKGVVYSNIMINEGAEEDEEVTTGLAMTALGVIIVNNLIPFTLGAIVGLYAIL